MHFPIQKHSIVTPELSSHPMLCACGAKNGVLNLSYNLFRIFRTHLHSSPYPSKRKLSVSKTPKATTTSLTTPQTLQNSLAVTTNSSVTSICSILSNNTTQSTDINNLLKDYGENLNSDTVLRVLMNYKRLGRIKTLEFFTWAGTQMGFQFDDYVVEYMADFLGRRKLFDDMKCLLITTLSHKGSVSCRVFSICIRFLGRQGRISEALCLFQEIETKFRCKPDNFVYNNMLYVLCKKETSEELINVALMIFRRIESPDMYSYSNILVGLCKFGRFETAIEIFREMGKAGLVPTRSAVNVLIGELCLLSAKEGAIEKVKVKDAHRPFTILVPNVVAKTGALQPAVGVFRAVYDMGLLPSAFTIIRLVSELCRFGKMDEAFEILKVAEERKLTCVEEVYSIVILALCENRLVEEVSHVFGRMLSQGLKPKLRIYSSVICMLCKLGSIKDAESVFEIMNKKRCLADNVTYTALVHAYGEARNWKTAYDLLIEMLGLGLIPHFHTYSLVNKLLKDNRQADLLIKLEGKLETQILLKYCKLGHLRAAYEKLKSMIEKGLYPPIYVRDTIERAFEKHGKLKMARELLEKTELTSRHQGADAASTY